MTRAQKTVIVVLAILFAAIIIALIAIKTGAIGFLHPSIVIYALKEGDNGTVLVPLPRDAPRLQEVHSRVRYAVERLLAGLTQDEEKAGYFSCIPEGAGLRDCTVEDGTVFLDFSRNIEEGGGTATMEARLAQIVFTATQFPGVNAVRFKVEGKLIEYFGGEGITDVEKPLTRDNFARFVKGGML